MEKATLGKGLQEENIQDENNQGELEAGIDIPQNSLDCRMEGNMHQARISKEMQYVE